MGERLQALHSQSSKQPGMLDGVRKVSKPPPDGTARARSRPDHPQLSQDAVECTRSTT